VNERDREWLQEERHHRLEPDADAWPSLFDELADAPASLYINGNPDLLNLPALAIVGSRNPTDMGEKNAFEFARHLGAAGFCIVSGLAQGIDAAAHRGALAASAPTVAFLGHGVDRVYPASNRGLAREIAASGALVSEFPLGTHPHRSLFPQRNRLISGMALGTLVVEAARRSGSLITARLAAEQGREVFAIPGSIHNPLSRGCHQLIKQGAKLVETADDIVAELAPLVGHMLQLSVQSTESPPGSADPDAGHSELLQLLGHDPTSPDELVERSGLTIDQVSSILLILELEGKVEKVSGGRYSVLI
jgi:DNA processing protein